MKSRKVRSVCNYVNEEIEVFFFLGLSIVLPSPMNEPKGVCLCCCLKGDPGWCGEVPSRAIKCLGGGCYENGSGDLGGMSSGDVPGPRLLAMSRDCRLVGLWNLL